MWSCGVMLDLVLSAGRVDWEHVYRLSFVRSSEQSPDSLTASQGLEARPT